MIRFISYDGKFPCLCGGTLLLEVNGFVRWEFQLVSTGQCYFSGGDEAVARGPWRVNVPSDLVPLKEEIERVVNAHVPYGCCGGCF